MQSLNSVVFKDNLIESECLKDLFSKYGDEKRNVLIEQTDKNKNKLFKKMQLGNFKQHQHLVDNLECGDLNRCWREIRLLFQKCNLFDEYTNVDI